VKDHPRMKKTGRAWGGEGTCKGKFGALPGGGQESENSGEPRGKGGEGILSL